MSVLKEEAAQAMLKLKSAPPKDDKDQLCIYGHAVMAIHVAAINCAVGV